jgi:hypothetical protein
VLICRHGHGKWPLGGICLSAPALHITVSKKDGLIHVNAAEGRVPWQREV